MSHFLFNGVNSKDLGLIITQPIVRPTWAKQINEISAPGRTSKIMQISKTYTNASMTVRSVISGTAPETIRRIYEALKGYGPLQISTAPEEYVNAYVEPLVPEAVAMLTAELPISFTLEPFAYAVEPTIIQLSTQQTVVPNVGTVFSAPEIRFTATGESVTVNVNGLDFIVALTSAVQGKEIIIDCDAEVAYYVDSSGQKISINAQTFNDYPLLHTGDNYVTLTGSISEGSINVRERWY